MSLDRYRHIVVEGPIGVGKTSFARRLAERLNGELLLEAPQENPFLEKFYREGSRHALATQLFFLFQRVEQLRGLTQFDFFERHVVCDFLLDKDPLFARLTLSDDEYALYRNIFDHVKPQTPQPDLVILLQAPTPVLFERIKRRGIAMEQGISEEYLERLAESYSRAFYDYDAAPLLIVNTEALNPVDRESDFDLLLERIAAMRSRREFFNIA
jgi:deoxyadenosine/deoxycytidine kinase